MADNPQVKGGVIPYLTVDGAAKAAEFYQKAFAAEVALVHPPVRGALPDIGDFPKARDRRMHLGFGDEHANSLAHVDALARALLAAFRKTAGVRA